MGANLIEPEETVILRIRVPKIVYELCNEAGSILGVSGKRMLTELFAYLEQSIQTNDLDQLGPIFAKACRRLHNKGAVHETTAVSIDISVLHRTTKTKCGFVGVYANGKGFAAHGPQPKGPGTMYLGTFDTAEKAAWVRYQHHKTHGIPYGDFADKLDEYRKIVPNSPDETVIQEMVGVMDLAGEKLPDGMPQELIDRARDAERARKETFARQAAERNKPIPAPVVTSTASPPASPSLPPPPIDPDTWEPGNDGVPDQEQPRRRRGRPRKHAP